jgi:predicted DNA-binding ribbon-helix-helix protein
MKSPLFKRSVVIGGHRTSVSLEDAFWSELKEIAHSQRVPVQKLIAQIDATRQQANLSSAIRLYVLEHIRRHGRNELIGAIRAD